MAAPRLQEQRKIPLFGIPQWLTALLLVGLYFACRLPNLRAMPVFCDEATYVRWAQLIHTDPLHNLWISMADAKLPMHYWLLAFFYRVNPDPIYAGRLLSVLLGAATIPLLFALGRELEILAKARGEGDGSAGEWFGPIAALFMILSPLAAMFQRMALAEPLLLLEAVALAWASLRLARQIAAGAARWKLLRQTMVVGGIWGATLLTKQNFSYLMWALPPLAMLLYCRPGTWRAVLSRFGFLYADATALGAMLFIPALFMNTTQSLSTRIFYKSTFFQAPAYGAREMLHMNLCWLFVPRAAGQITAWPYDPAAPLMDGALYLYLTPPVCLLLLAGSLWLARRRQHTGLIFLGTWSAIFLGVLVFNHSLISTRFAFLGLSGLLMLAAWIAADFASALHSATRTPRIAGGLSCAVLLLWPGGATVAQLLDYRVPTRMARDHMEYLIDSSAGDAAQQAVAWLTEQAGQRPIVIITGTRLDESDLIWIAMRDMPNVRLFCTDSRCIDVAQYPQSTPLIASSEEWFAPGTDPVTLPAGVPIFRTVQVSADESSPLGASLSLSGYGRHARIVRTFENPPALAGARPLSGLVMLRLDAPVPP